MAGGSKRQRDFPDFQRFWADATVFRRRSSHRDFLPGSSSKPLKNCWKKGVVNLYLVFQADDRH
jgi:hypothetical protein